ncbi:hypothetical protein POUND7_007731 [Theobroma cacao]
MVKLLVCFVIILSLLAPGSLKFTLALGNETDRIALLSVKDQLVGAGAGPLHSWNASLHFCEWQGVTCGRRHQRVTALDLDGLKLAGSLSPSIGNLTFLRRLNLSDNRLQGNIPKEVGYLRRLRVFDLFQNNLHGRIPVELANCSNLQRIHITDNNLTGEVPFELGDLSKLIRLSLAANNLVGGIASSLGNLSSLWHLSVSYNHLEGNIPDALGKALNLRNLFLGGNNLAGTLPLSFHNLSSLEMINLALNNFSGSLAAVIGILSPNLRYFTSGGNHLIGTIPMSISNLSNLEMFDISVNGINGSVPNDLGNLKNLQEFKIGGNYFGNGKIGDLDFLSSLSNCSLLKYLDLELNQLGGLLPESIGNLSIQLNMLYIGWNQISGDIPEGIDFGNLEYLVGLFVYENKLSGEIPKTLGECSGLRSLDMAGNFFQGSIPFSFGSLKSLEILNLSRNNLSGTIPHELEKLPFLSSLNLSFNHLEGEVPKGGVFNKSSGFLVVGNKNLCGGIPEIKLPKCFNQEPRNKGTALSIKAIIGMILGILIASILVVLLFVRCCRHSDTNNMGNDQTGSSMMKGTIGYVPPEYGMGGTVSPEGDIYSYGILLLEMITGRRPTDGMFYGGLSLHNFCKMALPERLKEILDFRLLAQLSENNEGSRSQPNREREILESLVSFTKIGVACSTEAPGERMGIKDSITQLLAIKARLLRTGIHRRERR